MARDVAEFHVVPDRWGLRVAPPGGGGEKVKRVAV